MSENGIADAKVVIESLQSSLAKQEEQLNNVDSHLEFVHQELAKSIFIIDKHSLEIDDLAIKCKDQDQGSNNVLISKSPTSLSKKSTTPPPRENKSPEDLKNEMDDLKVIVAEGQSSKSCTLSWSMFN